MICQENKKILDSAGSRKLLLSPLLNRSGSSHCVDNTVGVSRVVPGRIWPSLCQAREKRWARLSSADTPQRESWADTATDAGAALSHPMQNSKRSW